MSPLSIKKPGFGAHRRLHNASLSNRQLRADSRCAAGFLSVFHRALAEATRLRFVPGGGVGTCPRRILGTVPFTCPGVIMSMAEPLGPVNRFCTS